MLIVNEDGPVLRIILNRPEVRNAFNDELIAELTDVVCNLNSGVRAVILAGNGSAFCAGGDLHWMAKAARYSQDENFEDALKLASLFDAICKSPAVFIARVHGAAFGGGCGLVAAADICVATPEAKFAFSEVRLGLVPATISTFVLKRIGSGHARSLFTTGEAFLAEHALRIGLVHAIATTETIDDVINSKLTAILSSGPEAIALSKQLAQCPPMGLEESARVLAEVRGSAEGKEGVAAFLEKRSPSFKVTL